MEPQHLIGKGVRHQVQERDLARRLQAGIPVLELGQRQACLAQERAGIETRRTDPGHGQAGHEACRSRGALPGRSWAIGALERPLQR